MEKQLRLLCWNCEQEFRALCEVDGDPRFSVNCTNVGCAKRVIVDLGPYRTKTRDVLRGGGGNSQELPAVLPTHKPEG